MKKRISGILALSMTLALTLGMTAFAAPSPDTSAPVTVDKVVEVAADTTAPADTQEVAKLEAESADLNKTVGTVVAATVEVNGQQVAVAVEAPKPVAAGVMNSAKTTVTTIIAQLVTEKAIPVAENKVAVATPIAATDIKITLPAGADISKTGVQLTIPVANLVVEPGKTYVLMHLRESDGVWETIPIDDIKNGEIKATFKSTSPVVVVEVAQQDAPAADNNDDGDNEPAATAAPAAVVSPKTGEAVPVAVLLVFAALAGAAFCAKKLSYRK